jgi:polyhydroxyalkanoate synthesis regulator phasin
VDANERNGGTVVLFQNTISSWQRKTGTTIVERIMADNSIQSVQKLLQDLIAPDVRETKARLESLEKRVEARFDSMERQNESFRKEMDANIRAVLSAISELKSNAELLTLREVAALRERIAILEAQKRPH